MPRQSKRAKRESRKQQENWEDHEVDAILNKHVSRDQATGQRNIQYLIHFVGSGRNHWLPLEELSGCAELIAEFENKSMQDKTDPSEMSAPPVPTVPPGSTPSVSVLKWELMEKLRKANGNFNGTKRFYKALITDLERRSEQIDQCHRWLSFVLDGLRADGFQEEAAELAGFMVAQEEAVRPGCFTHTIAVPGGELQLRGIDLQGIAERSQANQAPHKRSAGWLAIQGLRDNLAACEGPDQGATTSKTAPDGEGMSRRAMAEDVTPQAPVDPVAEWQSLQIFQQHAAMLGADELSLPEVPQIHKKIDACMLPSTVFLFRWPRRSQATNILAVFCLFPNCKHNSFADHPLLEGRAIRHFQTHGLMLRNESEVLSLFGFKVFGALSWGMNLYTEEACMEASLFKMTRGCENES